MRTLPSKNFQMQWWSTRAVYLTCAVRKCLVVLKALLIVLIA